jgi:hypothetical protein
MNSHFLLQGPLRCPHWRLDRVVQMTSHRPSPLRPGPYDDHYVRIYRRVLLALTAAGMDDSSREEVFRANPDICHAHELHYSLDIERRQILEARLLTNETLEGIALGFGTSARTIDYFEKLFFNIRDRMQCRDWILKAAIIGPRRRYRDSKKGAMTDEQRGYVYRLFGFYGGPLVLDAVISGIGSQAVPRRPEDVEGWFQDELQQIVRISAAAAAAVVPFNERNMMRIMKMALRASARANKKPAETPRYNDEAWAKKVYAAIMPYFGLSSQAQ